MDRQTIFQYVNQQYATEPEYLWMKYPSYAVLRRQDSQKWYGIVMDVPREKLGLPGTGTVDILDVKCEPMAADLLRQCPGFLPGYHMNKNTWASILLDGTVSDEHIFDLLDASFQAAANKRKKAK